jgi:ethanolamine utilization cobalamin adenosyltransferase
LERAAEYRELAAAALNRAMIAESAWVKASQIDMAARWDSLAQDIERRLELVD